MVATNHYHLLSFLPAVEAWEMPPALETMARRWVSSGRLRINADYERNFVRHGEQTFSTRELTDPLLLPHTRQTLSRHVAPAQGAQGLEDLLALLHAELRKTRGISLEKELRVARVLVQSAHPSVIQLLLAARTEVFVSYAHNVSDLMELHRWQTEGLSNGLQATDISGTAVYVSCGGDPFFEGEHKTYTTDGFPALARMVVIAAQEFGHFSDLLRRNGHIVGRYSVDPHHTAMRAAPMVAQARLSDMKHLQQLQIAYAQCGLARLVRRESAVAFYHKSWRFSPPWLYHQLLRMVSYALFVKSCKSRNIYVKLVTYPAMRHGESIAMFLEDMAFNLSPDADAYRRTDPLEEEAIACIEAIARVPQQARKWGASSVRFAWPQLEAIYSQHIIPGCIAASPEPPIPLYTPPSQRLQRRFRHLLRRKPDYYPD